MKIAICDDEEKDLELIQGYCRQFDSRLTVQLFYNGTELLQAFEVDFFDLIFLDIEMGLPNGLEVGTKLVNRTPAPIIVFTTHSLNYAVRGYGIAMRYLPKPISYETFSSVMRLAMDKILPTKITVSNNGTQMVLSVADLLYIEVLRHNITFHLVKGELITFRGTLSEIVAQVSRTWFVQPHKSFCVNLDYVDHIQQQTIYMINGDMIPIARDRKELFQKKLKEYLRGEAR